jgi:8-oxo-dGTP diphosphatase
MKQSIAGIIYHEGRFLIGLRLPVGEMGNRWEFPGGKVDPGETPEMAIVREFREELGVEAIPLKLLTSVKFTNKGGIVELLAYTISLSSTTGFVLTEHTETRWATMDEISRLDFVDSDRLLFPAIMDWCEK